MFPPENRYQSASERTEAKRGFFSWIDSWANFTLILPRRKPASYLPYVLYLTFLGILYISNAHFARKIQRETMNLEKEVTNLRTDYTHTQAKYMNSIKYSEVEKKAKQIGLQRVEKVPYQIVVSKDE
ncbi:MAG: FtsL-like putative cell division protein [Raineya sp.]|nr:FtsL-like putative cell division protein [Raineya sp.]MDW8296340.1 FtsL-like putative cell division protein [Raineya sp.]